MCSERRQLILGWEIDAGSVQSFSHIWFGLSGADGAKGAIKDTAGKVTGDKKLESEGKLDKAKGSAHKIAGDVKDAVKHANE
jgi:uncharacterized protein YjbJ (UPF0337 family)